MSFGATDYFGFADTNWKCVGSSTTKSGSRAEVRGTDGDFLGTEVYDCTASYTAEYDLALDTGNTGLVTRGIKLGAKKTISSGVYAQYTRITLSTSNTAKPHLTIEATKAADSSADGVYYSPTVIDALALGWGAEKVGMTAAASCSIVGSEVSFTTEQAKVLNATGDLARTDVYGAIYEATNQIASSSASPSATADTGWTLISGPSTTTSNTAYATGTASVFKTVAAKDT